MAAGPTVISRSRLGNVEGFFYLLPLRGDTPGRAVSAIGDVAGLAAELSCVELDAVTGLVTALLLL